MGIQENWEKEDKLCPACGQVTEKAKGITKQNIKKLFSFSFKDLREDWLVTVLMIGICLLAWMNHTETKACNDFMNHKVEYCSQLLSDIESKGLAGMENGNEIVYKPNDIGIDLNNGIDNGIGMNGNGSSINSTIPWITQ